MAGIEPSSFTRLKCDKKAMATMETTPVHGHADWVLRAYQTHGTPAWAPVVIKLGYTVMHILEGQVVQEPPRAYHTFLFTLGDFLHQASRRQAISTVLLTAGVYGYDICFAGRLERQLVAFCNDPVETAFNSGNGIEMIVDVFLSDFPSDEEPSLDVECVGEDGDFVSIPASTDAVEELAVVKYERGGDVREESCIICFAEFDEGVEVTRMPCKHAFHGGCLTRWLERSHVCPLCRHAIPASADP
ncbi:E3 ubiquitin-protein ligase RING1-like [Musa acuminata AAA Group]|uniref:E3 ubiquitin-protein ligase RING1-like n=1 Tax=Musa acuminata AAA Group TaxID=214697 RepID=UPI0031CF5AD7